MPNLKGVLAGAAAVVVVFIAGYYQGGKAVQAKWDAAVAVEVKEDRDVLLIGMKDSFEVGLQHEQVREEIKYVTQTIVERIPVYINDTKSCPVLPAGFGRLHRESAQAINDTFALGKSHGAGAAATPDAGEPNASASGGG